jgi:hypothetical protein
MLDRRRRVAAEGHLFASELGVPDLIFTGRISGRLPTALSAQDMAPATFLITALLIVESLGSSRSRGLGHCRLLPQEITIDGRPQDLTSLLNTEGRASDA